MKRGIGRVAPVGGDGRVIAPPGSLGPIALYQQPAAQGRSKMSLALRVLGWSALVLAVLVGGTASGAYLYLHESVAAVAPRSVEVKKAAEKLDITLPGQPATALVIGYDRRADEAKGTPSRSDTLMLVRADPGEKTISMLSFPRDLRVEIMCPGEGSYVDKINAAYANCGPQGTLQTVRKLTGVPVNYLITVNFRGFRQLVDKLDGVWMDVDRRYFNDHGGPTGYAKINLQPGYQRMNGTKALDFVRFRHTDSDIYRNARQQLFVRAFKDQIGSGFSVTRMPQVIKVVTNNVEVAQGGGKDVSAETVLSYGLLAYSLPTGHIFQSRIDGLEGFTDLTTAPENIQRAVREFRNPDVESPRKATAVALGEKLKQKAPPPRDDERHGAERQRCGGVGLDGELPPLAAWVPDGAAAEWTARQRTDATTSSARRSTSTRALRRGRSWRPRRSRTCSGRPTSRSSHRGSGSSRTARCWSPWSGRPSTTGWPLRRSTRRRSGSSRPSPPARVPLPTCCGRSSSGSTSP